jgi:hypothetical protein
MYHFRLDQGFESVNLAIGLLLDEPDLTERALSNNPNGSVVLWPLLRPQEPEILYLCSSLLVNLLCPTWLR